MFLASTGVSGALTDSLTSVGSEMTGIVADVLPIALPIIGSILVITFGIKIFKKITGKS